MIRAFAASLATAALATSALGGGIDRSGQSIGVIFEPGNYVEFSFRTVDPVVSGVGAPAPAPTPGALTGDVSPGYGLFGTALKFAVNDKIDTALIFDQPFGADLAYPTSFYFAGFPTGATARLRSNAFTGIARYKFTDRFSVYGGLRQQSMKAGVMVPYVAGYTAVGANDDQLGYLVGAAYERPDIALRVALTYYSSVEHNLSTFETSGVAPLGVTTTTKIETPQAINLDFQTGIAPKTLLFGGVRWVEWSKFDITPPHFAAITGGASLVSFSDDRFTFTLGVGRQLNENWSIAGLVTHEPQVGGFASNLQPTDGYTSVGVGVTYRQDNMKLQAGLSNTWVGDATTALFGSPVGDFAGNTALAFGMKVGFSF
jgi:long-chain fatty acid transport protein